IVSKTYQPTFAITTRSGISTQDPPFATPPRPATNNFTEGETKKQGHEGSEPSITQEPTPRPSILYQPSKTSNLPFPSRLKKRKKDDEDERFLSIFKQIHINLPFLEAMIHMTKGAKVLKDLLSHKEKLEKSASLVKLSEECSAIIQRSLPQKEGEPGSFTLPYLIRPLAVKNAMADLGATGRSIYQIPHRGLREYVGKSRQIHLPRQFCNFKHGRRRASLDHFGTALPRHGKRPFLATAKAVIDVHEGKLSLRVRSETITFNIGKSMKSKHFRDDYLYCADHTAKLIQEQWVDTANHDRKWTEEEEEEDSSNALVVSFYPRTEPVVLKKGGMVVVNNEKDELIVQQTVTGWRVCIDYRKLNNATRKYHFPLPFIDQMLERLAGHEYYCFLDGFSGYFKISITPEDQDKTTFTALIGPLHTNECPSDYAMPQPLFNAA
ncbi:hypothetical protein Tco_0944097, partial [Tanacetum coccineum]